jgi:hypothetical protein
MLTDMFLHHQTFPSTPTRPSNFLMSARGGRAASGPWSRLKPVNVDPLEAIGLPSKGDNRQVSLVFAAGGTSRAPCLLMLDTGCSTTKRKSDTIRGSSSDIWYSAPMQDGVMSFCEGLGS